jgi:PAS domain S-box-containing protein
VNQRLGELVRAEKEHLYGKSLLQVGLPGDFCTYLSEKARQVFARPGPCEFEFPFETREGRRRYQWSLVAETDIWGIVETVLVTCHDVTRVRPGESEYAEELAFRKAIERSIPSGIMAIDLEGRITYVNPVFCKMIGWDEEELIRAKPPYVYWAPEDSERDEHALQEVLSGKRPSGGLELRLRKKNGDYLDVSMMFSELKDLRGNVVGWVCSFRDISELKRKTEEVHRLNLELEQRVVERTTRLEAANKALLREVAERTRAEKDLCESEERFSALVMASSDAVYRMSPNWSQMRELKKGEFILNAEGQSAEWLERYVHPEDRRRVKLIINKAIRTKSVFELEHRVMRGDGSLGWTFSRAVPLLDTNGDIVEWFGTTSDITERRRADDLRKALSRIHLYLSSDAEQEEIMENVLGDAARALGCESAAISLKTNSNWTVSHVYGFSRELIGTETSDDQEYHAVLAINTGDPVVIEDACNDGRVNRQHTERYGIRSVLVVPILKGMLGLGAFFFNYHTAVTRFTPSHLNFSKYLATATSLALQRWALVEGLRERTEQLERANVELEAFAHTVSHDLKSPLVATRGFCHRLTEHQGDRLDEKGRHYLRRIDEGCQAMDKLIEGLLALSKLSKTTIKYVLVDLSSLARLIAEDLKIIDPQRDVTFVFADALEATGDPVLLKIALQNLIGNAWKFTGKQAKTVIEFGSSQVEGIPEPVYFIRDNGCGFDMAFGDRLFRPFQRFHSAEEFPGTGIGLASAYKIVERHGGHMWAESIPGQGATFFFTLPPPLAPPKVET